MRVQILSEFSNFWISFLSGIRLKFWNFEALIWAESDVKVKSLEERADQISWNLSRSSQIWQQINRFEGQDRLVLPLPSQEEKINLDFCSNSPPLLVSTGPPSSTDLWHAFSDRNPRLPKVTKLRQVWPCKNIEEEELVSFVIVRNTGYDLFEVALTENLESRLRSENIAVLLNFPFIAMFAQFQFPSALPPWSYLVAQLDVI